MATIGTTSSTSVDPVAAIADIAEREGLWLHVDAAYAGAVALLPGPPRAVRGLGARRFDRRQPAQVAVHAARRLAAADAPDGRRSRAAFSLVPEYLRTLDRATPVRDYNEYTPQLGRRFRALKLWIQLRWFGLEGLRRADRASTSSWPSGSRRRSTPTRTGSGWRPSRSRRSASAGDPPGSRPGRTRRRSTTRNAAIMDAVNRTGEVFLSHTRLGGRFTIRVVDRQPADRARATSSAPGRCSARPRAVPADGMKPEPARRPVLRDAPDELRDWFDANAETADELWLGYYKKATGRPSVTWPEAVDEALCVGWIDGVRYTPRRGAPRPAVHAAAQGQQLERDQRRQGRDADGRRVGCARPASRAFEARTAAKTGDLLVRAPGRGPHRRRASRGSAPNAAAWADWERRPPSYRRAVLHWVTSAKQAATRERRLAALIEDSAAGRPVKPLRWAARRMTPSTGRPRGRPADALVARLEALDLGDAFDPRAAQAIVASGLHRLTVPADGGRARGVDGRGGRGAGPASARSTARRRSASRCRSTSSGRCATRAGRPDAIRDRRLPGDRRRRRARQQRRDRGGRRIAGPRRDPRARSRRPGDDGTWRLTGEKTWTTWLPNLSLAFVTARIAGRGAGRGRSRSWSTSTRPGVERRDGFEALGMRGSASGRLVLDGVDGDARRRGTWPARPTRAAPAPGAWFGAAIAATYLGVGEGARTAVARWALGRRPGDGSTASRTCPSVRLRLGRLDAELRAARTSC